MTETDYPTCRETHAELRIHSEALSPASISEALGVEPTRTTLRGEPWRGSGPRVKRSIWILSSKDAVDSRDLRRHIEWLLEKLSAVAPENLSSVAGQSEMRVWVSWWSAQGHGGPILGHRELHGLAELGLELHFDLYFADD